jgi:hypothetical protein
MTTSNMSIGFSRLIRMINYDPHLPLKCFASARRLTSPKEFCDCVIECRFIPNHRKSQSSPEQGEPSERRDDR